MSRDLVIGKDVPWNAAWSGESRYSIQLCRWTGRPWTTGPQLPAVRQPNAPGEGRPLFAEPHMVRQRRSVAQMLCTVCGEPTIEADRWMFAMGDWARFQGGLGWATTESPVHCACADLAASACPQIRKRGLAPVRFPDRWAVVAQLVGGPELLRTHGLRVDSAQPVVGHLKIVLPPEFARTAFGAPTMAIA